MKPPCAPRIVRNWALSLLLLLTPLEAAPAASPSGTDADPVAPFFQPGKLRALVLSGRNNHDWRTTTPWLRRLLVESGRFDVRVEESVDGLTATTLAPFDVLIMDYGGPRWSVTTEAAIESFVRSGKGFVAVHGASYHFSGLPVLADGHRAVAPAGSEQPWPAFRKLVGCGWDAAPSRGYHGPRHTFAVRIRKADHPVVVGLPAQFPATDELYQGMTVEPEAEVLATAFSDPDRGGLGREEPMLVATHFGQGRGFYTALGHEIAAMAEPGFRTTFLRGSEWAATGTVTLPASLQPTPPPSSGNLRVLVVTGGHDYDPAFYGIFQDRPGFHWRHAPSQREAFARDLQNSTEVVVLYDMASTLEESGRAHLRAYLESGGGLVVLHHALADFQDWPWWSREVVGARYVLQAEPGHPGSDYLHDQWMELTPAGAHPVTDGVGPLRLFDETYKGVWQAPGLHPLLTTSNPTSDPVVGWIGPWAASRVVVLQPGHGRETHTHPAYVQLVGNAIRWVGTGTLERRRAVR